MEQLIDYETAAKLLGVQPATIYTWVSRRKIPFVKVRGALRFRPSALESLLKEREYQPEKEKKQ